jgi:riboflavin biosynthesis pyrimidine reductase
MTRFVHIGDIHSGPGPRNVDRFRALDQIIREGQMLSNLGAWLVPGDLSHARQQIDDKNELAARLQVMASRAPVLICDGNHDLPGDLAVFAKLASRYPITVYDRPTVDTITLATGERATVFVLPYPTKAGLTALGVAHDQVVSEGAAALDAIFTDAGAQLRDARSRGELTFAIGHVNVAGALSSVGQPNIGHEIELDASQIAKLGDVYVGLNHIHKAQSIGGAHYPGSICRLDWGEIEAKGYIVVTCECVVEPSIATAGLWRYTIARPPIDVAPMYHVEGELTRDGFAWQATKGPGGEAVDKPASWRGCEVRVRYRFKQSERSVLSDAVVMAEFAEAARLDIEPIAVPDRALRSPAVAAARTLDEKLRAWATANGGDAITEGIVAKLARLEHGDHLHLLTDLQTRLAAIEAGARDEVAA